MEKTNIPFRINPKPVFFSPLLYEAAFIVMFLFLCSQNEQFT